MNAPDRWRDPADCARARGWTSAWLDGELVRPRALDEHWAACAECSRYAERLRALRHALEPLRKADPPPDLWTSIERRALPRGPRVAFGPWLRVAAGLAGFVLTLAAVRAAHTRTLREAPSDLEAAFTRLSPARTPAGEVARLRSLPEHRLLSTLFEPIEEHR